MSWERFAKFFLKVILRFEFILPIPLTLGQKQNAAAYSLPVAVSVFLELLLPGILLNAVCFGITKAHHVFQLMRLHNRDVWQSSSDNTCQIQLLHQRGLLKLKHT